MSDDRSTDQFIREVDEEMRREQLRTLWERYGVLIIAVCVLVVLLTAGYRGWVWWREKEAAESGDRFIAATEALEAGDRAKADAELAAIVENGAGGYPMLARLRAAALLAEGDDPKPALAAFDAISADDEISLEIRELARVRAALVALDAGDLAGASSRVTGLDVPGQPWRHLAREIQGLVALRTGEAKVARERFAAIQSDAQAPQGSRDRAGALLELIDGTLAPVPAASAGQGGAGTPADTQKTN